MASTVPPMVELHAPPSWRTVDFISDLHLAADTPATFSAWQHYLQNTPADAVFILGDLFEVWVGDDSVHAGWSLTGSVSADTTFEDRCARLLGQMARKLPIFFMHGNRDFLVGQTPSGPTLMALCNITLLADPTVLVFPQASDQGPHADQANQTEQRWLLSHGDALCLDDADYLQFRQQVRSTEWQQTFLARPLAERQAIARGLRQQSQQRHQLRQQSGNDFVDVDRDAARRWLQAANARTLIHGHTHRPARHALGDGLARVVLSDWDAAAALPRADVLRLSASGLQRIAVLQTPA